MGAPRLDVLTPIHKGLQLVLCETAILVGRTDFTASDELARAEAEVRRCLTFLVEHAGHEDRWVAPELRRLAPALAERMTTEHARLEQAARAVAERLARLAELAAAERAGPGSEVRHRLSLLSADQLRHMTWEEEDVDAALWSGMGDQRLAELAAAVAAEIGPARMRDWDAIVLAAVNRRERAVRGGANPAR